MRKGILLVLFFLSLVASVSATYNIRYEDSISLKEVLGWEDHTGERTFLLSSSDPGGIFLVEEGIKVDRLFLYININSGSPAIFYEDINNMLKLVNGNSQTLKFKDNEFSNSYNLKYDSSISLKGVTDWESSTSVPVFILESPEPNTIRLTKENINTNRIIIYINWQPGLFYEDANNLLKSIDIDNQPLEFGKSFTEISTECIESWTCTSWSECATGTQTRSCIDSNNCGTINNKPEEAKDCIVGQVTVEEPGEEEVEQNICSGCLKDKLCIPFGTRIDRQYCDLSGELLSQKIEDTNCNNNYECESNLCISDKCVSAGLWQKFLDFLKSLFNPFGKIIYLINSK